MANAANTTIALIATITATGSNSTVPDHDDAVDADITVGGRHLCSVTLIGGETWGSPDNWCDIPGALEAEGEGAGLDFAEMARLVRNAVAAAVA